MSASARSGSRRRFIATAATLAATPLAIERAIAQPVQPAPSASVAGIEHWTTKRAGADSIKLFMWQKRLKEAAPKLGSLLFVHGSSMASTPAFDLHVPGKPEYSVMDHFARLGYDTWCLDHEGYGRSDKSRNINFDIATGAVDLAAAVEHIVATTGEKQVSMYGISSGALRAALYAQRSPERVKRLALDAMVWTGEGSPTLANRRKRLAEWQASNRRPIDHAMVQSIFTRDHPGTADPAVVNAFADAILALDQSVPTGTYLDMSVKLPLVDPEKITVPTLVMRGQWDGIAGFQDVINFFVKLPNPDKHFAVMPGIAHSSLHEKNFAIVYHTLDAFMRQPEAVYRG